MTRLLIVRHGQTQWNTQHRMQGQQDSPLTATGRELARRLAVRLENLHIDGVFTSPLGRAQDTARILISGRDLRIEPDARLKELNFGRWEGEDMRTLDKHYSVNMDWFWQNPNRYMEIRGGETYDALLERTRDFLRYMSAREGTFIVVTHAVALRSIRQNVLGLDTNSSSMSMPSCCMCQVDIERGEYDLRVFGDRYHHDDSILDWWYGAPEEINTLRAGSIITRIRPLAEARSHNPKHVMIGVDSRIAHDGKAPGYLYRVNGALMPGDVVQSPHTSMPLTYEWLTTRELKLELVSRVDANARLDIPEDNPELTLNV